MPGSGPVGATVIITGNNFSPTPSNNIVYFGPVAAIVNGSSATSISVTVPASAACQPITVTVNGLTAYSANPFMVTFPTSSSVGNSSFAAQHNIPNVVCFAAGDFDGDGKVDMAASYAGVYNAGFALFKNSSTIGHDSMTLLSVQNAAGTDYLATGDLDGDGKLDVAAISGSNNLLMIYKNSSTPGNVLLAKPVPDIATAYSPSALAVGDLNADGKPDVAVVNRGGNILSVYINTTAGGVISFAPRVDFSTPTAPMGVVIADLNGDGKPDIATGNSQGLSASIFQNNTANGVFALNNRVDLAISGSAQTISVADIDGDGKPDLVTANYYSNTITMFRNKGVPNTAINVAYFDLGTSYTCGLHPYAASVADVDGDGKPDIVAANINDNSVSVFRNASVMGAAFGPTTLDTKVDFAVGTGPIAVALYDMDGDGKPEIVSSNLYSVNTSVLRNLIYGFTPSITGTQAICLNGSSPTITFACQGGTAPYTFTYNINGGASQAITTATGNSISLTAPTGVTGTFTYKLVKVADNNGVVQQVPSSSAVITVYSTTATLVTAAPLCAGGATGMVTLSGNNGTGPYKYKASGAGAFQSSGVFTNLAKGSYVFVVKDAAGCTGNVPVTLIDPPALTASLAAGAVCSGGTTSLTATSAGGTSPYQYALNNGPQQTSNIFTGQPAGDYTLTVTDANACTVNSALTVNAPATVLSGNATVTNVTCNGGTNGAVTLHASGGYSSIYVYSKNAGGTLQITGDFTGLEAGTYTFVIVDSGGCKVNIPAVVTQPAALKAALKAGKLCKDSITNFTTVVNGGTAPYLYSLNGGAQQNNGSFSNLPEAGSYSVLVTDANGCSTSSSLSIPAPAIALSASIAVINSSCFGYTDGSITAQGIGGYPPYQYKLAGFPVYSSNSKIDGLQKGGYLINVKDSGGCIFNISGIVNQPAILSVAVKPGPLCVGSPTTLTATGKGGTAPYQYSINGSAMQSSAVFSGQPSSGNYALSITDINGCKGSANYSIKPPSSPLTATLQIANVSCFGFSDGHIVVTASGGYSAYMYKIGNSPAYQSAPQFNALNAGGKVISVQDSGGCIITVNGTVTQPTVLKTTLVSSGLCFGGTTTLTAKATGGTSPYQYKLNSAAYQASGQFTNRSAGNYGVTAMDAKGCAAGAILNIVAPTAALTAKATVVNASSAGASNGKVAINATGGVTPYLFRKGFDPLQSSNTYVGLPVAVYTFTVQDANGCAVTVKANVKATAGLMQSDAGAVEDEMGKQGHIGGELIVKAYPNPSLAEFTLQLEGWDDSKAVEVRVMDMQGKMVYHTTGSTHDTYKFGKQFAAGMYIAEVISGRNIKTVKLTRAN